MVGLHRTGPAGQTSPGDHSQRYDYDGILKRTDALLRREVRLWRYLALVLSSRNKVVHSAHELERIELVALHFPHIFIFSTHYSYSYFHLLSLSSLLYFIYLPIT